MFNYADGGEEAYWDCQIIGSLLSLNHEKKQASILMLSLPGHLGRPRVLHEAQRARIGQCFDTVYHETNYGHLYNWEEEEEYGDVAENEGRIFESYIDPRGDQKAMLHASSLTMTIILANTGNQFQAKRMHTTII